MLGIGRFVFVEGTKQLCRVLIIGLISTVLTRNNFSDDSKQGLKRGGQTTILPKPPNLELTRPKEWMDPTQDGETTAVLLLIATYSHKSVTHIQERIPPVKCLWW